jgi:hypothetical protein
MTHGSEGDDVQHRRMTNAASRGVPIMFRSGDRSSSL